MAGGNGLPLLRQLASEGMILPLPGSRETTAVLLYLFERLDLKANQKEVHHETLTIYRIHQGQVGYCDSQGLLTGEPFSLHHWVHSATPFEPQNIHAIVSGTVVTPLVKLHLRCLQAWL